jgi:hypothetical protein
MFRSTASTLKILQNASCSRAFSTESSLRTDIALLKQELTDTRRDILDLQKIVQKNERNNLISRSILFGVMGSVVTTAFLESYRAKDKDTQRNYHPTDEYIPRRIMRK